MTMRSAVAAAGVMVVAAGLALTGAQVREPVAFTTCGTDKTGPALPVTASNVILAGDSRLFTPCADGSHPPAHVEQRWTAVISAAIRSPQPEMRRLGVRASGDL